MDDNEAFANSVDPVLDSGLIRFYTFFCYSETSVIHRGVVWNFMKMKPANMTSGNFSRSTAFPTNLHVRPSICLKKAWMFG